MCLWLQLCLNDERTRMRSGLRSRHWRGCAVPGLTAIDCPNKDECGTIIQLTEEDRVELYRARLEDNRRIVERVRMTRGQTASYLLSTRGCPQTPETLGVTQRRSLLVVR